MTQSEIIIKTTLNGPEVTFPIALHVFDCKHAERTSPRIATNHSQGVRGNLRLKLTQFRCNLMKSARCKGTIHQISTFLKV